MKRQQHQATLCESAISSAHLVGICGSGMKALAELLDGLGCQVTGSDLESPSPTFRALQKRGLRVHSGHQGHYLPHGVDVLVYSPAVGPSNPERRQAARRDIPQLSYSEMLGLLMRNRVGVSIAGTHGKSTTAAMTTWCLAEAGLSPSAVVGAELCRGGVSGLGGRGDLFVVEACEYQRSFLDLHPKYAAILAVEPDHFDYYRDFEETISAFSEFAGQVASDGAIFIRSDCPAALEAGRSSAAEVITFSLERGADWWAADPRQTEFGTRFRAFYRGDFFSEICLTLPGKHQVANALAAVALCHRCGLSADEIREGLYEFPGIRRRYERIGSWCGVTLIDDYAHHPTAVRATLQTAREEFPHRRIWCVFQPHQVSRTRSLMSEFAESFTLADEILIAPIFTAREELIHEPLHVAEELALRITRTSSRSRFHPSLDRIITTLEDETRPGDVLITMGAGDINRVYNELTGRLRRNHPH